MANEPVTDNKIIECPKCKNKTNIANDKCPACGTSLKELRNSQPTTKPKVHPTNCPACNSPVKKTDNFCGVCGAPVDDTYETINAKYGIPLNKTGRTICGTHIEVLCLLLRETLLKKGFL